MVTRTDKRPRRIVDSRGHRVPLFVRLCEAFVDNLARILRVALVVGGIYLAQSLADFREVVSPGQPLSEPPRAVEIAAEPPLHDGGLRDSEIIKLAEECTHADYWQRHYDKCFPDGSEIYPRPDPGDLDDAGFLKDNSAILFASLATGDNQPR